MCASPVSFWQWQTARKVPFEPKGCVLKTTEKFPQSVTNAIDANIIEDAKTGEQYMLYGSFWGGCHVLKLNKTTGFAEEEGIGVSLHDARSGRAAVWKARIGRHRRIIIIICLFPTDL